jgi:hypothetical protein
MLVGQVVDSPVHVSAGSQIPADERQLTPAPPAGYEQLPVVQTAVVHGLVSEQIAQASPNDPQLFTVVPPTHSPESQQLVPAQQKPPQHLPPVHEVPSFAKFSSQPNSPQVQVVHVVFVGQIS